MRVTSLSLSHFRNYERALIEPDAGVTVFTGPNAQGKTNVLEALHLCCLGRSHRTSRDEELIQWGRDSARVTVKTAQRDGTHEVAVVLSRTQRKKKTVRIGLRQAERIGELLGHICGVLFSPEDLQIVKDGPAWSGGLVYGYAALAAPGRRIFTRFSAPCARSTSAMRCSRRLPETRRCCRRWICGTSSLRAWARSSAKTAGKPSISWRSLPVRLICR